MLELYFKDKQSIFTYQIYVRNISLTYFYQVYARYRLKIKKWGLLD